VTDQPTDTSGTKDALRGALTRTTARKKKARFRTLTLEETTALVGFTRTVDKPSAPPAPTVGVIGITTAGRQHYGDAGKSKPAGTLPTSDYGLKQAVITNWVGAYESSEGKWRMDLGSFETPRDKGGKDSRPWYVLVAVESGNYTVTHYGPGGAG
jgi:hypothetical protein